VATEPRDPSAVERDLVEVRRQLAARAHSGLEAGSQQDRAATRALFTAALLAPLAGLPLIVAALAAYDRQWSVAVPFALLGAVPLRYLVRNARRWWAIYGSADTWELQRRERQLVAEAGASLSGAGPARYGEEHPLPPSRQPTRFAQQMQSRFRIGGDPVAVLRALPDDAPAWKVGFYRYVGWSTVAAACLGVGLLLLRVLLG
jgi:hypothetical protein